jgi:DNA-binding NarL/FixJ family response regulator
MKIDGIELEILEMICLGKTNSEISEDLLISQRTLEGYKSTLINRTGVKDTLGLAIYAVKNHLVDIN